MCLYIDMYIYIWRKIVRPHVSRHTHILVRHYLYTNALNPDRHIYQQYTFVCWYPVCVHM